MAWCRQVTMNQCWLLISDVPWFGPEGNVHSKFPCYFFVYRKTSNIIRTLVGNKIADHSDVVGASPVGAAPTTSSFSTWHLVSWDSAKQAARQYENLLSVGSWCILQPQQRALAWGDSTWPCFHIAHAQKRQFLRFSSLAALEVVKMITSSAAGDGSFVAATTFSFRCIATELLLRAFP